MVDRISCRWIIIDKNNIFAVNLNPSDKYYCLPWWTLEKNETLNNCIEREIKEELWVKPNIWNLLYVHEVVNKKTHLIEFFFEIKNIKDFFNIKLEDTTHWFEINKIKWLDIFNDDNIFLPKWLIEILRITWIKNNETKIITSL